LDEGDELVGWERLDAADDVQAVVFVFDIGIAAEHDDGQAAALSAEIADKLGAVHARHLVVGDDQADRVAVAGAEKIQSLRSGGADMHKVPDAFEDAFASYCLQGVVIDKQNIYGHSESAPKDEN